MTEKPKIITVFGSSRPEDGHADYVESLELGRALAAAGFAVCTGGYGGVMEAVSRGARESGGCVLAVTSSFFRSVVWEMLNKKAMEPRPFVVLGDFWQPILDRVREVERGHASRWGESSDPLVHRAPTPADAARFLAVRLVSGAAQGKEN
jgi:predicted Rossmann-fold nucleotide-binding protein